MTIFVVVVVETHPTVVCLDGGVSHVLKRVHRGRRFFFWVPCISVVSHVASVSHTLLSTFAPSPLQGYWSETADARDERLAEEETAQETRKERWELQASWKVYGRLEEVGAGIGGSLPCVGVRG